MISRCVCTATARRELLQAARHYTAADRRVAAGFLAAIDHAMEMIRESPERWPAYLHGTRRYVVRRFPYLVVYRRASAAIEVVAIAHQRRKPGYWVKR